MSNNFNKRVLLLLEGRAYKNKGIIPAYVIYGAAIALLIIAGFFYVLLQFYGSSEITISDKIADGLSSINYFYLTEKNINEFAQIVTEITAKELGEACGGFECYSWSANNPTYADLRDKFESELRGKITGFPTQIGNGGRISFEPPRISGLEMDEGNVKISLFPQQVYRKTSSFLVNASSEKQAEIDKNIRYLLLAKIGQQLYGNGTYVRDWGNVWVNSGKFDCNNDGDSGDTGETIGTKTKLSDSSLNNCKILDIDFNVDDTDGSGNSKWNSYAAKCYNILNNADPGEFAGKVEVGKIYVQIDSLLEKSLICGIDGTDGLASVMETYGEISKSNNGKLYPSCSIDEARDEAWEKSGIDDKVSAILSELKKQISGSFYGIDTVYVPSLNLESADTVLKDPPAGGKAECDCAYYSCGGKECGSTEHCDTTCDKNLPSSCSSSKSSGACSSSNSCAYSNDAGKNTVHKEESSGCSPGSSHWQKIDRTWYSSGYFEEKKYYQGCGSYCYPPYTYCTLGAYFKFTFTPDISFKITDNTIKIVKKGTTDFEDLYFAVKFKPGEPYVIGDPDYIPPTEYTCTKTAGQTCETSCSGGKVLGSGTCKSGICCGEPPPSGDKTTFLKAAITNNKADACTSKIKWEVKAKNSASFTDYSADCVQGNPEVTIDSGKSLEATCTSQKLPTAASGPHKERITWCGESIEFEYGQPQTADISVTLKYPETYGQPSAKTLKLSCKKEILGTVQSTDVEADYETINLGGGLHLVKFKFTKEKLQQLKDAGCDW